MAFTIVLKNLDFYTNLLEKILQEDAERFNLVSYQSQDNVPVAESPKQLIRKYNLLFFNLPTRKLLALF